MLTTQYLEEADRLADDIVVLDHGRVVARRARPAELKARIGGERIDVTVADADRARRGRRRAGAVRRRTPRRRPTTSRCVTAAGRAGTRLIEVVRALDAAGVDAIDVHRREATLDDVFLSLTGTEADRSEDPT